MQLQIHYRRPIVINSLLLLTVIVGSLVYFIHQSRAVGVISPLAEETREKHEQYRQVIDRKTTDKYPPNEYFPLSLSPAFASVIDINARAYAVMDRDTRELLFAKNLTTEMPIASVTKIMTAIVAMETGELTQELRVSVAAAEIGEATMGLTAGDRVTVEELLYGLLLPSGNDAAEVLAEGVTADRIAFMRAMNDKARELGLYDTFFFNPSGLDENTPATSNFSTVLDLLALSQYALNDHRFADIVSRHEKTIPARPGRHQGFMLYNKLQLDRSYPGIKGVKPGNTDFAGETLVSYAENGGRRLIVVLLGAKNSRDEVIKLYDYIYSRLGIEVNKPVV